MYLYHRERREGCSEAWPLGPLVKVLRTVHSNENRVILWMKTFFEKKNGEILKLKSKKK
jgi:hypothetical protein